MGTSTIKDWLSLQMETHLQCVQTILSKWTQIFNFAQLVLIEIEINAKYKRTDEVKQFFH